MDIDSLLTHIVGNWALGDFVAVDLVRYRWHTESTGCRSTAHWRRLHRRRWLIGRPLLDCYHLRRHPKALYQWLLASSLLAAVLYIILNELGVSTWPATLTASFIVFLLRYIALRFEWEELEAWNAAQEWLQQKTVQDLESADRPIQIDRSNMWRG